MDELSEVFIFTDMAPNIFGKYRSELLVSVILFVIGLVILYIFTKVRNEPVRHIPGLLAIMAGLGGGFLLIVLSMVYLNTISIYRGLQTAYDQGMYQVAEGTVSVSHVQPAGCYETGDLITIDDIKFEINYCHGAPFSYSQTINQDGVLTDGAYVRVYYTQGKTILRVDVRQ